MLFYVLILSSVLFTTGCDNLMNKSLVLCNLITAFYGAAIHLMKIEVRRINPCPSANLSLIVMIVMCVSCNCLFYVRILSSVLFTTGCKNLIRKSLVLCNSLTAFCGAAIHLMKIEVRRTILVLLQTLV